MSRLRQAVAFLAGFLTGVVVLYVLLLVKGQLVRGPSFAVASPAPPAVSPFSPLPAAPTDLPAASPASSPPPFAEPAPPTPPPSALPATPSFVTPAPWAPQAEAPLAVPDAPAHPLALPAPAPDVDDFARLRARGLAIPVQGVDASRLRDNFSEMRGGRVHEAIDILAPRGTPVVAVDDGVVKKLFTSAQGGLTVYEFDRDESYCYYYAHLDRYADGLREGMTLKKGDLVGYVGTTGNAPPGTPHLHFTIFKLAAGQRWWEGTPINPYPLWALRR